MSKPKGDSNTQIPNDILRKLLTQSEIRMLKNRYKILSLLEKGHSIRSIAKQVKVGTDTVVRVARMFNKKDLGKAISSSSEKKIRTNTPWIFGKSND